jgi:hypothetical protein
MNAGDEAPIYATLDEFRLRGFASNHPTGLGKCTLQITRLPVVKSAHLPLGT